VVVVLGIAFHCFGVLTAFDLAAALCSAGAQVFGLTGGTGRGTVFLELVAVSFSGLLVPGALGVQGLVLRAGVGITFRDGSESVAPCIRVMLKQYSTLQSF
jgi:cytochrome bd-type quinol oxidase subunit 2